MAREDLTPVQQQEYDECLARGCGPNLAEMLVLGQPPAANTDREFWRGRWNQFENTPEIGDDYRKVAEQHGQNTAGKFYVSGLAKFPGDPEAWVADKGEMERLIDREGWGAEGCVNRPIKNIVEAEQTAVADDIVDREVGEILETVDPRDRPQVDTDDLREQVLEKRKPLWAK